MSLPDVSAGRLREALEQFDREFRDTSDFANWEQNHVYKWAIEADGRRYPVKKIVSLATGAPTTSFNGGPQSNDYVRSRGLTVVDLQVNALQATLEGILRDYLGARNTQQFGSQAEIAKTFERCKRLLSSRDLTERYPTLKVKASYGQGNWAKVPWIAFLDARETDTTQRGVYPVILFRQDCTGCYVTLNQGVTEPIERLGSRAGLEELRSTAKSIRLSAVGKALTAAGFTLDDAIDLRADPGLGQNYEASTIAHKYYEKGAVPADSVVEGDVEAVLDAYGSYVDARDPAIHLLLKWSPEKVPDTIERHKRIADETGSVWWGKFGTTGISGEKLSQISRQLERGRQTKVYLSGAGTLWEATLRGITLDKAKVERSLLPDYYTPSDAKLFVRIGDFQPVTREWFIAHALLDSNPEPGSGRDALTSQANPAYVRVTSDPGHTPAKNEPVCLLGTSRDIGAWFDRARERIASSGGWASWWSFTVKDEARGELKTPFDLYINTGGGEFPVKCTVSEYETSRGSTGIVSPWPEMTDEADVGKLRAGDTQSQIFKTWLKLSKIENVVPSLRLGDFEPAQGLSTTENLLNPNAFGYARLVENRARSTMDSLVEKTFLDRALVEELVGCLTGDQRQIVLAGPPGTSKTFIAESLARFICQAVPDSYRLVQFHPSYGYESFIEGLRPVVREGGISFEPERGLVLDVVTQMVNRGHTRADSPPYLIVIDEMNRANLPRVFGELMYLFEYRDRPIRLQYTRDFVLPPNLGFIGSMNTADRSIRSIDAALRRRFDVFEFGPSSTILKRFFDRNTLNVPDLLAGFERLNSDLESGLGRHYTIGHAFFMKPGLDRSSLSAIWRRKVYPLIEEYFFDQPDIARGFTLERYWSTGSNV